MSQKRPQRQPPPQFVEVVQIDDGYVLFVGRASVLFERADAEAVIVSLTAALARRLEPRVDPETPAEPH